MANNLIVSAAAAKAALKAVTDLLDAGGAGTIKLYDGTQPAGPGTGITTQNLLVTLTFSATSFGGGTSAVPSVATANAITSGTAVAGSATAATWARWASGAGTAVIDCTVGASAADINLTPNSITTGQTVAISSLTLSHP